MSVALHPPVSHRRHVRPRASAFALAALLIGGAVPACFGVIDEGLVVDVELVSPGGAPGLLVSTSGVELVPCDPSLRERFAARAQQLLLPAAHAHLLDTELRIGTAIVEDFTDASVTDYGRLRPPPGRYCGVRTWWLPADDDAVGLDAHPHALGRVVLYDHAGRRTEARLAYDRTLPLDPPVFLGPAQTWTLRLTRDPSPFLARIAADEAVSPQAVVLAVAEGLSLSSFDRSR